MLSDEELISLYLTGNSTPAQHEELLRRINSSAESKRAFELNSKIWSLPADQNPPQYDATRAYEQFLAATTDHTAPTKQKYFRFPPLLSAVAALLLVVLTTQLLPTRTKLTTIATAGDERRSETLSDSSVVTLNADTRLSYHREFTDKQRKVTLTEGEAFFEIARDTTRPFTIAVAEQLEVQVLGTSFTIDVHKDSAIAVAVATGTVALRSLSTGEIAILHAGEAALYTFSNKTIADHQLRANYNAWRTGLLQFQGEPLHRVIGEIEMLYDKEIHFPDSLREKRFTAKFDSLPYTDILTILSLHYDLQMTHLDDSTSALK